MINCYYYAPHVHSTISRHLEWDFAKMADMGVDVVSICIQETHLNCHSDGIGAWHAQRVRNVRDLAHKHGLKIHAVPNRWAGLTAGWIEGFNHFTVQHPDTFSLNEDGTVVDLNEMPSSVCHPKVIAHFETFIPKLFNDFGFDGLVWDEPHAHPCFNPEAIKLRPSDADPADWYYSKFAEFVNRMSGLAKQCHSSAVVSLFIQPGQEVLFDRLLDCEHLDFIGSDGHVRRSDYKMHRMKGTIFDVYQKVNPKIVEKGRKSMFLMEAQRHRDEDLAHYLEVAGEAFRLPMDQLMFYYSAHEMTPANEAIFNEHTWKLIAEIAQQGVKKA